MATFSPWTWGWRDHGREWAGDNDVKAGSTFPKLLRLEPGETAVRFKTKAHRNKVTQR